MPSKSGVRAASLRIAVLACATLAWGNAARADEPLARWMIEMDGGLSRPHGRIREAFGGGESLHVSLAHAVRRHIEVAGAAFEGGMPYALAADEIGSTRIPEGHGRVAYSRAMRFPRTWRTANGPEADTMALSAATSSPSSERWERECCYAWLGCRRMATPSARTAETWVDFNLLLRLGGTRKD